MANLTADDLCLMVASVLSVERRTIDIDEDLMELGMDSLMLLELAVQIEERTGRYLRREIVRPLTVRQLAETLSRPSAYD